METDLFDSLDPLTNTSFLSLDCEALRNLLFPLQPQTLPKLETKQLSTRVSTQKRKAGTRQDTASALRGGQASAVRSGLPAAKRRKCHAVSEGRASPNQRSKTKHEAVDRSSEFDVKTHHVVGNGKVSVQAWTSSKDAKVWAAHCVGHLRAFDILNQLLSLAGRLLSGGRCHSSGLWPKGLEAHVGHSPLFVRAVFSRWASGDTPLTPFSRLFLHRRLFRHSPKASNSKSAGACLRPDTERRDQDRGQGQTSSVATHCSTRNLGSHGHCVGHSPRCQRGRPIACV